MRKITKKTAVIVAGSTLLVAVGGGVAFAFWSSTGTGSGTAAASAGTGLVTISQATAPSDLAPNVAPEAVTGTISNSNPNSAYVNSLIVTISGVDSAHSAGCSATDFGLTTGTTALAKSATTKQSLTLAVGTELAHGASVNFPTFNIGFANDSANSQDGCKGASPTLSYSTN
ncbi:MAG TPA: hypothetical protein VGM75_15005 [Pseudonocardiaceae bacterium]|jgi:hypothetical protein